MSDLIPEDTLPCPNCGGKPVYIHLAFGRGRLICRVCAWAAPEGPAVWDAWAEWERACRALLTGKGAADG